MRIDGYYNRDQTGTRQGRSLMAFLRAKRPLNSVPVGLYFDEIWVKLFYINLTEGMIS